MDVTPQLIEQIDFSEKFRGYDPDQVDDFLERVGATLSELTIREREASERAERLESEVRSLRERSASTPPPSSVSTMTEEQEIEQATRTLLMAKRTADATTGEARQEAAQILADARAQIEQLGREAQAHRDELHRRALEDAEREFGEHRVRFTNEIASLEAQKAQLAEDLAVIEARLGEYRSDLQRVHGAITSVLEDPASLRVKSALDIDLTSSTTAASAAAATAAATDEPVSPFYVAQPATPAAAAPGPEPEPRPEATTPEVVPVEEVSIVDEVPESPVDSGDPWGPGSWADVSGVLEDEPEPAAAASRSNGSSGASRAAGSTSTPFSASAQAVATEPEDEIFRPRTVDTDYVGTAGESTQAYPPVTTTPQGHNDRYLRELDEAVNTSERSDDAMTAFFEGDDPSDGRRFGRRR